MVRPTLIIFEDGCEESAAELEEYSKLLMKSISISQLSLNSLKEHWRLIWEGVKLPEDTFVINENSLTLLDEDRKIALPLLFLANQFGKRNEVLYSIYNTNNILGECFKLQIEHYSHMEVLKQLHERNITDEKQVMEVYEKMLIDSLRKVTIPIVISMPGVAIPQTKYNGLCRQLPNIEREVIKILGIHRAIARNGIYIELDCATQELFQELNSLEISCTDGTNNKYVWNILTKLGKLLSKHISELERSILMRSKQITVFSDFPIGLAIFDDFSAPFCCYKSITYRPLTPLTRALQFELTKQRQHYIGKHCKVIIAECLSKDDRIRKYSDCGWDTLKNMCKKSEGMKIDYKEIDSVSELKIFLNSNIDADILIISAHGSYHREANMAGICVGEEVWMANSNDFKVPPLVLLSACHVSPRGAGAVSVADLFIRNGAIAVLGTFIPVDVRKNSLLMVRLFVYIMEAQAGSNMLKTLDEAWSFVVASNAVNEIIGSSKVLMEWAMKLKPDGSFPLKDFQLKESIGKLRYTHIYEDTMKILGEMLAKDGLERYLEPIVKSKDFFAESLFYQLIGFPENIFLHNNVFEEAERAFFSK